MAIDLNEYKDHLKSKTITEELSVVIQILNLTLAGLDMFNYYAPVQDIIGHIEDAKKILEIHLQKHKEKVEAKEKPS